MMQLLSPNVKSSRSVLADWLELQALTSPSGRAGRSALDSIFRFTSEERSVRLSRDIASQERDDGEIIESELETLILDVIQEIEWRQEKMGCAYPFSLRIFRSGGLASGWDLLGPARPIVRDHLIYVTCLLIVAFRRGLLAPDVGQRKIFTDHRIGLIFQICACLAIGGFLRGEVVSFGWPRAAGDDFLPALRGVWARFGAYTIVSAPPPGVPESLKDGGVDIVAWRGFTDRRPSRLIIFGQVASGDNWVGKSARGPAETLTGCWFSGLRPKHWLPVTLMPFVAHEEVGLESCESVLSSIFGKMQYHEQDHGLIFDRIRIVETATVALSMNCECLAIIDGSERIGEISDWINAVLGIENQSSEVVAA